MSSLDYSAAEARLRELIGPTGDDAKGRKRMAIVNAATGLFIRHGYRKTSIEDIARASGVAKGTVYLYFGSKIDVMVACVAYEKLQGLGRMTETFAPDIDGKERLRRWLEQGLLAVARMPLIGRLMSGDHELSIVMQELPADLRAQSNADRTNIIGALVQETAAPRILTAEELEERVAVFVGIFHFAPLLGEDDVRGGIPAERFARVLSELLIAGLST